MFGRVLIANRGEIAVRIARTLHRLGVESVAVYTEPDRGALHVEVADRALALGDQRAYLDVERLVAAARRCGADAVHPGYGFLSENAAFARACTAAGVVFVGPPAPAIELMGDKISAKRAVAAAGVPVVPGTDAAGLDDAALAAAARTIGFPVLLKPSAGGGGKGMRLVAGPGELADEVAAARREALAAFGDGTLLVERYVQRPRHVEVQVFADAHGTCVALGERECSLQRRHQKIVEEAPAAFLSPATRRAMAESAVTAARTCGYVGAGTVELIMPADRPDEYFFMEMNTRLQVEHPVTEAVLGCDLVELQLRVAAGERLPWSSTADVPAPSGHAVEARLYAEDPGRGFLPSSGTVLVLREPERAGIRVDSGLRAGLEVGTQYDPLLAKVVAWAPDRAAAIDRLDSALGATAVLGLSTNVGFLRRLLADPAVRAGHLDTGLVERRAGALAAGPPPDGVLVAATVLRHHLQCPSAPGAGAWSVRDGWRFGGRMGLTGRWRVGGETVEVSLAGGVAALDGRPLGTWRAWEEPGGDLALELDGRLERFVAAGPAGGQGAWWIAWRGDTWRLVEEGPAVRDHSRSAAAGGEVTSPMPGTVLAVHVQTGQSVGAGDRLAVVEAMKMEHVITAPAPGTVTEVLVEPGQSVRLDQPLIVVTVEEDG